MSQENCSTIAVAIDCRTATENGHKMIRTDDTKNRRISRHVTGGLQLHPYRSFYWLTNIVSFQTRRSFLNNVFFQDNTGPRSVFWQWALRTGIINRNNKSASDTMMTRLRLNVPRISRYVGAILPGNFKHRGARRRLSVSVGWLKGRAEGFPAGNICQSGTWECARQVGLARDGVVAHAGEGTGGGCYADH
jgi:hypothetical protein